MWLALCVQEQVQIQKYKCTLCVQHTSTTWTLETLKSETRMLEENARWLLLSLLTVECAWGQPWLTLLWRLGLLWSFNGQALLGTLYSQLWCFWKKEKWCFESPGEQRLVVPVVQHILHLPPSTGSGSCLCGLKLPGGPGQSCPQMTQGGVAHSIPRLLCCCWHGSAKYKWKEKKKKGKKRSFVATMSDIWEIQWGAAKKVDFRGGMATKSCGGVSHTECNVLNDLLMAN